MKRCAIETLVFYRLHAKCNKRGMSSNFIMCAQNHKKCFDSNNEDELAWLNGQLFLFTLFLSLSFSFSSLSPSLYLSLQYHSSGHFLSVSFSLFFFFSSPPLSLSSPSPSSPSPPLALSLSLADILFTFLLILLFCRIPFCWLARSHYISGEHSHRQPFGTM